MAFTSESNPVQDMLDLLKDNWPSYKEAPLPQLIVVNPGEEVEDATQRIDMTQGDAIIIRSCEGNTEQIRYRGNISVIDRIHCLELEVQTMESRQRMRNIYKVLRMVLLSYKHHFPNWQLIRMLQWQEFVNAEFNTWRGILRLQLEKHGYPADSLEGVELVP